MYNSLLFDGCLQWETELLSEGANFEAFRFGYFFGIEADVCLASFVDCDHDVFGFRLIEGEDMHENIGNEIHRSEIVIVKYDRPQLRLLELGYGFCLNECVGVVHLVHFTVFGWNIYIMGRRCQSILN